MTLLENRKHSASANSCFLYYVLYCIIVCAETCLWIQLCWPYNHGNDDRGLYF